MNALLLRCATTNSGKLREFRMAASHFGFDRVRIEPLEYMHNLPECLEDGDNFEANAVKKALHYSAYAHCPLFADDSGLEVDALSGAPGVRSARYAGPRATDEENNRLLLEKLEGIEKPTARFVCVIALAHEGRLLGTFRGAVEGHLLREARGRNGFGYDPLFFHEPFGCTFAEATPEQKMEVSHRGRAAKAMLAYVTTHLIP
jgi:XTP/dITP diphosphohydrolase